MVDFSALHVALSGLRAAQLGMDTTSHNVSNASTEGYTRQRVDFTARRPRTRPFGQLGTGVTVTDITRGRNLFLDARVRTSMAGAAEADVRAGFLRRAEAALGEPDLGVTRELSNLLDSFEELAVNPADTSTRMGVLVQLDALATRVNQAHAGVEALRSDAMATLRGRIAEVNDLLGQVAKLNEGILETNVASGSPNDLMDKRDVILDRLSQMLGIRVTQADGGAVQVSLGGISLVSGPGVRALAVDASGQILHPSGLVVVPGGEILGLQQSYTTDLPAFAAKIDDFAVDLATALNTIHTSGYHAGGTGGPLLSYDPGNPAKSLARALTDPAQVATATSSGPPFPVYDGGIAEQLAALRTSLSAAGGTATLSDAYSTIVTALGRDVSSFATVAETQQGLAVAAERSRMSAHGVSVDEEMVSLMEYQRMYEAAARVITAVDEALDVLINRTGLVGR